MKRKGNFYKDICSKDNIRKAIIGAAKGKKNRGNVAKILENIDKYVDILYFMLSTKNIKLSPYKKMTIHDGANKKERIIFKPAFFPDQCIHWCLMLQLQPILLKGMYEYCCASVPNRGIHYGSKYIKRILKDDKKNTKYCLKLDIRKFYPSIDKNICKGKFRAIIKDYDVIELIDNIVDSNNESGLPIGNFTSQWFANFYLQDLDHYIKEKLHIKYYLRYMDDMILFSRNKKELHKVKNEIDNFLKKEGLNLKNNWQLFKVDSRPVDFLGYRFYRGYTTLRRSNFLRIKRRVKKIVKRGYIRLIDAQSIISYHGWLSHCDSFNYTNKYIKSYKITLRKCKGVIKSNGKSRFKL